MIKNNRKEERTKQIIITEQNEIFVRSIVDSNETIIEKYKLLLDEN